MAAECSCEISIGKILANSDSRSCSPKLEFGSKGRAPPCVSCDDSKQMPLASWEEYTKGIGSKLLLKMGYVAGGGLGRNKDGRVHIVEAKVAPKRVSLDNYSRLVNNRAKKEARKIFELKNQANSYFEDNASQISADWVNFIPSLEQYEKTAFVMGMDCPVKLPRAKRRILRRMMQCLVEKSLPSESNRKKFAETGANVLEITIDDDEESKMEAKTTKIHEVSIERQDQKRTAFSLLDQVLDDALKVRQQNSSKHFERRKGDSGKDVMIVGEHKNHKKSAKKKSKRVRMNSPAKWNPRNTLKSDHLYRVAIVDDVSPHGHMHTNDVERAMASVLQFLDETAPGSVLCGPAATFDGSVQPARDPSRNCQQAPQFERCELVHGRLEFDCVGWHTVDFLCLAVLSTDELWHTALLRLVDVTGIGDWSTTPEPQPVKEVCIWLCGQPEDIRLVLKRFHVQNPGLRPFMWQDTVTGDVIVSCKQEIRHDGLQLNFEGKVNLQPSKTGVLDAFNSIKPIELSSWSQEICKNGKFQPGKTEVPFQFILEPKHNKILYETYHGVHIAVQYVVKCELKRSFPAKSIARSGEFMVEYKDHKDRAIENLVTFTITPESLLNSVRQDCGKFVIHGQISTCSCLIDRPFSGELTIKQCDKAIKSIELQLFRVETVGSCGDYTKDSTDIQTIQICDGNVCRNLAIPMYMIFPRLFTCPTLETPNFRIEFEISLNVIFSDDLVISETFPITLHRY